MTGAFALSASTPLVHIGSSSYIFRAIFKVSVTNEDDWRAFATARCWLLRGRGAIKRAVVLMSVNGRFDDHPAKTLQNAARENPRASEISFTSSPLGCVSLFARRAGKRHGEDRTLVGACGQSTQKDSASSRSFRRLPPLTRLSARQNGNRSFGKWWSGT
jgi:hypothetical protein